MLAMFPFSWLCTRYGARNSFFVSGLLSALSTALIPAAAGFSFFAFVCVRIVQGLAYACDFVVIGVLCTRWASLNENAKFLGFLTCFSPLSTCITNSVSGVICESETFGWPWVNYFHAIVSLVLFLTWFFFYTDDPRENRFVSAREVAIIHCGKTDSHINMDGNVPYLEIFKDKVVLAVWLNAFTDLFCAFFLIIYAPIIFKKLLNFGIVQVGLILGIVSIANVPVKIAAGFISDNFYCLSERRKMWVFNSVAVLLPAAIFGYLALAPELQPIPSVVLFASIFGLVGFNCGGFYKCGALVSRQYAEFVIAFTQFIKCVVYFVAPALVSIFVDDDYNLRQWQIIFGITSAMLIISNLAFCIYATDEPRPFTKQKE